MLKLIYGVATNDATYKVKPIENGKRVYCPYYIRWSSMLQRAYSKNYHAAHAYKDVTVCDEWLSFMTFRAWMVSQDWKGKHLDKDIIKPRNLVYAPTTCRFVTQELNVLLPEAGRPDTRYPRGVTEDGTGYKARGNINGKDTILGRFNSIEEASNSYITNKLLEIQKQQAIQTDPMIALGLALHMLELFD